MKRRWVLVVFALYMIFSYINLETYANENSNNMTLEVDLVGFTPAPAVVSIQVPERIYLGNLSKKTLKTDDIRVDINNTGNVNITVTPTLKNPSDKIFNHSYFKRRSDDKLQRIGNWSISIGAPDEEDGYRKDWFYIQLDLKNYEEQIKEDVIGYKADIVFLAMPQ